MGLSVYRFYRGMAFVGIGVLLVIAAISVISITGRALIWMGLGPVPGDFELVEVGTALSVFCFLPWTHLRRAHALVDLFWGVIPKALKPAIVAISDVLMFGLWALLVWRMGVALEEYRANGETSFILLMPVWWGYAISMVPAVLGLFAYLWKVLESFNLVQVPSEYAVALEGSH